MPTETEAPSDAPSRERPLSDAARRALAEAQTRREAAESLKLPAERGGRDGPEPVRYGDWEKNGIISDF
ncbi:DUF1674 domain-containing protein [Aureimonas sp. Leaf454]|uniref:DUF1674 domain-containing protein n=1 Tax=Aureimonas sp. Leaf454 TaxID=1736381 RepID=UPI000B22B55D|nr:DUF1674 domain-containing protein [Aureimonas sp. Leaf454]